MENNKKNASSFLQGWGLILLMVTAVIGGLAAIKYAFDM